MTMMMIIEKIIAGAIALVFGIIGIMFEAKVERTRSAKDTAVMMLSIGAYCAAMIAALE